MVDAFIAKNMDYSELDEKESSDES